MMERNKLSKLIDDLSNTTVDMAEDSCWNNISRNFDFVLHQINDGNCDKNRREMVRNCFKNHRRRSISLIEAT